MSDPSQPTVDARAIAATEKGDWVASAAFDPLFRQRLLDPPAKPGDAATIDRFAIIKQIGQGGMGLVFLGLHPVSGVEVAIKIINPSLVHDARSAHQFLNEARHMSRLSHPNILKVLDVSDRRQGPYYVMPFMPDGSLSDRLASGKPLDAKTIAIIARGVAEGLSYAHDKGIIHRDLKPANVLLDEKGQACLSDFGLVRTVFNDSIVDVRQSQCEGTAAYMSPGVAGGSAEDTRCDIYSFGAMLYEMLTGRPPYEGRSTQQVLDKIAAGPPERISKINPLAPPALAKIAEGAMARELRDRYARMQDVVQDLVRAEEGRPAIGPHGRERKSHSWATRSALATVLLALAFAAGFPLLHRRPAPQAPALPVAVEVKPSVAQIARTFPTIAPASALGKYAGPTSPPMSQCALVNRPARIQGVQSWTIETLTHRGAINAMAYSPNGRYLATGGDDGTVRLWSPTEKTLVAVLVGHDDKVSALAWSPTGLSLASAGYDGTVRIWDAAACRLNRQFRASPSRVYSLAWSPDGKKLATGDDLKPRVWDAATGEALGTETENIGTVSTVAWGQDSRQLVFGGIYQRGLLAMDTTNGVVREITRDHQHRVSQIRWAPDFKTFAVALGGLVEIRKLEATDALERFVTNNPYETLSWAPDGKRILIDFAIHSLMEPRPVLLRGQGIGDSACVGFCPDGLTVATATRAGTILFWSAQDGSPAGEIPANSLPVASMAWSVDSSMLALATLDSTSGVPGTLRLVTNTGDLLGECKLPFWGPDAAVAWVGKHPVVAYSLRSTGSPGKALILLVDPSGGTPRSINSGVSGPVAGSPVTDRLAVLDGNLLADHSWIHILNTSGIDPPRVFDAGGGMANSGMAWSPDGEALATGHGDTLLVKLWDASGKPVYAFKAGGSDQVRGVNWSPDGKTLAVNTVNLVELHEAGTGKLQSTIEMPIGIAAWSPDGTALAPLFNDRPASVHDAQTGEKLYTLNCPGAYARAQDAFSAAGWRADGTLSYASHSGTIYMWNGKTGEPLGAALVTLRGHRTAVIGREGICRGTAGAEKSLLYVALTDKGQETLSSEQFAAKYGWRN